MNADNFLETSDFTNPVVEFDAGTGETSTREMTEEELLFSAKLQEEHVLVQQNLEQVKLDRQSAINKLSALGLTEEEISALLGIS
jgi:DNA-directed RNA polymerase specialized sigma24 family protein